VFVGSDPCAWLLTLPLALWGLMGCTMIPAIFLVTYLLLGVDEIGVEIEAGDAFRTILVAPKLAH
jgi:hypothetical protein